MDAAAAGATVTEASRPDFGTLSSGCKCARSAVSARKAPCGRPRCHPHCPSASPDPANRCSTGRQASNPPGMVGIPSSSRRWRRLCGCALWACGGKTKPTLRGGLAGQPAAASRLVGLHRHQAAAAGGRQGPGAAVGRRAACRCVCRRAGCCRSRAAGQGRQGHSSDAQPARQHKNGVSGGPAMRGWGRSSATRGGPLPRTLLTQRTPSPILPPAAIQRDAPERSRPPASREGGRREEVGLLGRRPGRLQAPPPTGAAFRQSDRACRVPTCAGSV